MMFNFLVRIEGRGIDFVVKDRLSSLLGFAGLGKQARCMGFFASRYVIADSEEAASSLAQEQIAQELVEKKVIQPGELSRLRLRLDELSRVLPGQCIGPGEGFTFFQE
jgi:hypothetical protein